MALRWFRRVVWLGILANFALAVPTLVAPARMIRLIGLPPATPLIWPQFAALLIVLLSLFYMPAAINPTRYRVIAWLAVLGRFAGVIFFLVFQSPEYRMLGYFDLIFFVSELALLLML